MQPTDALATWLGLMTAAELADLAASYDWTAVHLDWSARPQIAGFLTAVDALVIAEQRRRVNPAGDIAAAADSVALALLSLDKGDLQILLRSYRRMARNREKDASEPVQRFHIAVGDLLAYELAARLGS
jgi:hypothetical protein